jgi:ankyrin repeat protein
MMKLLASGLDVNTPDPVGRTPLVYAVVADNKPVAEWLLKNGAADPSLTDNMGMGPCHWAASQVTLHEKNKKQKKTDLPLLPPYLTTGHPLTSCHQERSNMLKLLIHHGAPWHLLDQQGRSVFHWAATTGGIKCLTVLQPLLTPETAGLLNSADTDSMTPLVN